jgi:hypothetical protein
MAQEKQRDGSVQAFSSWVSEYVSLATADDFESMWDVCSARGEATGVDPVDLAIVSGAKNGQSLERVREWSETAGVEGSTFEMRLAELEEAEVVKRVDPGDGNRLQLDGPKLGRADVESIAGVVSSI